MKIENVDRDLNITRKYITPDLYINRSTAKSRLTLPYAPHLAVWTFESSIWATKSPSTGWGRGQRAFDEDGGGREATINQPFPVRGAFLLGKN